jgi:hypothetical protein
VGQGGAVVAGLDDELAVAHSGRRKESDTFVDVCLLAFKDIKKMTLHISDLYASIHACTVVQRL